MSKKLINIAKEFNVGIGTAAEFLQKKGHNIDVNPNSPVSDEEIQLLAKEFKPDYEFKVSSDESAMQKKKEHELEKAAKAALNAEKAKEKEAAKEIKIEVQEISQPKVLGKMDLSGNNKKPAAAPAKPAAVAQPAATPAPAKPKAVSKPQPTAAPKVEKETPAAVTAKAPAAPAKPTVVASAAPAPAKQDAPDPAANQPAEIFRLHPTPEVTGPTVLGKMDLSSLNQKTRPNKKSKEEKKKERDARFSRNGNNGNNNGGQNNNQNNGGNGYQNRNRDRGNNEIATSVPRLNGPKVLGTMDVSGRNDFRKKGERPRIHTGQVDVNNNNNQNNNNNNNNSRGGGRGNGNGNNNNDRNQRGGDKKNHKRFQKSEVNEEDVRNSVKNTLSNIKGKGGKFKAGVDRRKDKRQQLAQQREEAAEEKAKEKSILKITEFVTVRELATMMDVPVTKVISTCMALGQMVSINQRLDAETINIVAEEFGFKTEYISAEVAEAIHEEEDKPEDLVRRPPVVTVMGHVDHGKTSLLDYIRKTNVIAGEAGGITQHIGAYNVTLESGQQITFLDTPGHEAFTAMRARGAQVADVAIIIVAADDDVMPQTVEALNHASNAGVPIVFAINKIDKPAANPDKIKESLSNLNYLVEDWGGQYQCQEIAAKKGTGVKELMEKVLLAAELLDLKANPNKSASGIIIESQLDKGRGYTSTVLVNNGTLRVGDVMVAGINHGKIKAMFNERGTRIEEAKPAQPALILGLDGAPTAGDKFNVMDSEQEAREVANKREQLQREQGLRTSTHLTLDEIGRRIALGDFHEMNIIVKGDVDGSVEALSDSLQKLSTPEIQVNIIHKAVGQISESDVMLAAASNAIIIGFQVRPSQAARKLAEQEKIDIRLHSIIYDAIEQLQQAMEGMLSPEIKEVVTGSCEVQSVFKISKVGTIAGCMVTDGKIKRTSKLRVIREGIVIHTGELESLKRFKDDAKEVVSGLECGLNIVNYNNIEQGDIIEAFDEIEVARKLK